MNNTLPELDNLEVSDRSLVLYLSKVRFILQGPEFTFGILRENVLERKRLLLTIRGLMPLCSIVRYVEKTNVVTLFIRPISSYFVGMSSMVFLVGWRLLLGWAGKSNQNNYSPIKGITIISNSYPLYSVEK